MPSGQTFPATGLTGQLRKGQPGTGHRVLVTPVTPGAQVKPVRPDAPVISVKPGTPVTPGIPGAPVTPVNTGQKALEAQDTQLLDRSELIVFSSTARSAKELL